MSAPSRACPGTEGPASQWHWAAAADRRRDPVAMIVPVPATDEVGAVEKTLTPEVSQVTATAAPPVPTWLPQELLRGSVKRSY